MQFLFIIGHDDSFRPTDELLEAIHEWIAEAEERGARILGAPLRPPGEAMTVRIRNGHLSVADGPFSESAIKMCAFELIECAGLDEAIELAARHPMAAAATIEIRPVWTALNRERLPLGQSRIVP